MNINWLSTSIIVVKYRNIKTVTNVNNYALKNYFRVCVNIINISYIRLNFLQITKKTPDKLQIHSDTHHKLH